MINISSSLVINVLVECVVLWVVFAFLIPLLPAPFGIIATVVCVGLVIVWLLRLAGLIS